MIFGHRDGAAPSACDGGSRLREEPRRGHRRRADGIGLAADQQAQFPHQIFQGFRLCIEFFRGAGALLRAGGIALGDLIHLGDGGIDLLDTLRLLAGGSSDFRDKRVGRAHLLGDLRERLLDLGACIEIPFDC